MKYSIKRIFEHLKFYLLFIFILASLAVLLTFEEQLSFDKINNLNNQKKIIQTLTHLDTDDIELALIQFTEKAHNCIKKLTNSKCFINTTLQTDIYLEMKKSISMT